MSKTDWDQSSTVLQHRFSPSRRRDAVYRIEVVQGPDQGKQWTLSSDHSPVWLGTSPVCAMVLSDPTVSRRHVRLAPGEQALLLSDDLSTNGTFINGVRVRAAELGGQERVVIGATTLQLSIDDDKRGDPLPLATSFQLLRGASAEMRCLYPLLEKLAASDVSVLIEGETGTGKEVLAESIHRASARRDAPFVVFDCTAVSPSLIEATLFGHERGAYTGAHDSQPGLLDEAGGGTLFIDEIGDLSIDLQPKLLRVIERREWRRLGSTKTRRFDARIVAATRRDLDADIERGAFRDDLFHRLAIASVELPPLRERRGDILLLAQTFWRELGGPPSGPPTSLLTDWERERWAGNVRELRNAVARALALGTSRHVPLRKSRRAGHVDIAAVLDRQLPIAAARALLVDEFERRYVERVLREHDGNVTQAALAAGVSRRYLHRLKSRWSEES